MKSKFLPVKHMDKLTRKHCPNIDHFVVFTSHSSRWGRKGHATYEMASSAIESLCERRRKEGLPALVIQWGPINDTGDTENSNKNNIVRNDFAIDFKLSINQY